MRVYARVSWRGRERPADEGGGTGSGRMKVQGSGSAQFHVLVFHAFFALLMHCCFCLDLVAKLLQKMSVCLSLSMAVFLFYHTLSIGVVQPCYVCTAVKSDAFCGFLCFVQ